MNRILYISLLLLAVLMTNVTTAEAQKVTSNADGTVIVDALFKYPEAPPYLDNLNARCDYLMDNFWNDMDFRKKIVNQSALQHAFSVYTAPMQFATKGKVLSSVAELTKKLKKNPTLMTQFMKAAEETLHSARSEFYIDEVYELFLESFVSQKKVKKEHKHKYSRQLEALRATAPGSIAPQLELTDTVGNKVDMPRGSRYTLLMFGNPSQNDLRLWLTRLNTSVLLEKLAAAGDIAVVYADTKPVSNEWREMEESIPAYVTPVFVAHPEYVYDIRFTPSCYLLDGEGKVIERNLDLMQALNLIRP